MPPNNELGREAVSALATATVVIGGIMALVFVIVVGTDQPGPYLAGVAAGAAMLIVVLFLARSQPANPDEKRRPWWKILGRRTEPSEPQIILKRRDDLADTTGCNQPPTAEQLRDIKDHGSTWVPNRTANRR